MFKLVAAGLGSAAAGFLLAGVMELGLIGAVVTVMWVASSQPSTPH